MGGGMCRGLGDVSTGLIWRGLDKTGVDGVAPLPMEGGERRRLAREHGGRFRSSFISSLKFTVRCHEFNKNSLPGRSEKSVWVCECVSVGVWECGSVGVSE